MKAALPLPRRLRGFSLIELMVTIAVLAVLLALAAPSFAALVRQWRLTSAAETLAGDLRLARSTAIRTSRPVALCTRNGDQCGTGGNWATSGWLIFSDLNDDGVLGAGEPLIAQRGPQAGIASINRASALRFRNNGSLSGATAGLNIIPAGADTSHAGLSINITAMGRVSVVPMTPKATDEDKE